MGIEKFLKEDITEKETLTIRNEDYKRIVNEEVKETFNRNDFNLLNLDKEKKDTSKKVAMSVYFNKEDLDLLKAIAFEKNITVNKILMNILREPLSITRENIPNNFDINQMSKEYDVNSRKRNK